MTHVPLSDTAVQLEIGGMTCAACAQTVERTLGRIGGVQNVSVNLASEKAYITYDPNRTRPEEFGPPLEKVGYHLRTEEVRLHVVGLDELVIRQRLEHLLSSLPGVLHVRINGANGTVVLDAMRGITDPAELLSGIVKAGFSAVRERPGMSAKQRETRGALVRLTASLALTIPLWMLMMGRMTMGSTASDGGNTVIIVEMLLGTLVQWGPGYGFATRAWANVRRFTANMDVLVAMATLAAWVMSLYGVWSKGPVYFNMSATVISIVLLGKYLESRARTRTTEAIQQLAELTPRTTRRVTPVGKIEVIPLGDLTVGDVALVRPGDRIPVDGVLLDAPAIVDESLLTGEVMPVRKLPGAHLSQGTLLRGTKPIRVKAARVGKDTELAQVVRIVERAQADKPSVQNLADRIASVFVPIVMVLSFITLWVTGDWMRAVAVLVAACPCALGLATPTAIAVGTGIGARRGILFRHGESLERANRVDTILLDKTGTLTLGHPEVIDVTVSGPYDQATLEALAAGLETGSGHPLADAFMRLASGRTAPMEDVYEEPGCGVVGTWQGHSVLLGNERLLRDYDVALPSALIDQIRLIARTGATPIVMAVGDTVAALFTVADPVRPDAAAEVAELKVRGYRVVMVTGDHPDTAEATAAQLGIGEVRSNCSPEVKAQVAAEFEANGRHVAMVGDGLNDAPALARAYLGIAVASGRDIASDVADITLLRSDVRAIGEALRVSRRTMAKIRQNYGWALIYNAVMIPLAAAGIVSPIVAGSAMAFSSVAVVTNSISLHTEFRSPRVRND